MEYLYIQTRHGTQHFLSKILISCHGSQGSIDRMSAKYFNLNLNINRVI